jgi:hypothetical protein
MVTNLCGQSELGEADLRNGWREDNEMRETQSRFGDEPHHCRFVLNPFSQDQEEYCSGADEPC